MIYILYLLLDIVCLFDDERDPDDPKFSSMVKMLIEEDTLSLLERTEPPCAFSLWYEESLLEYIEVFSLFSLISLVMLFLIESLASARTI